MSSRKRPRHEEEEEEKEEKENDIDVDIDQTNNQKLLELPKNLEPTIFNTRQHSDLVRFLSDFLYKNLKPENIEHLEIEAKLGLILDKDSKTRISIPVMCETIIAQDQNWIKFESNLTLQQHEKFNILLNQTAANTQNSNYHGAKITYQHLHETDRVYDQNGEKTRVTIDEHGNVIEGKIIQKVNLANLNIYSPRTNCDYRISINVEKPMEMPMGQYIFERQKNRISYNHQLFKVDLTQVFEVKKLTHQNYNHNNNNDSQTPKHELEVEFIDPKVLYKEKLNIDNQKPSKFRDIVEIFVNNITVLARKCSN